MNTATKVTTSLDDRIIELAALADQIGAIATCATNYSAAGPLHDDTINGAMHGIETLSEILSDRLAAL